MSINSKTMYETIKHLNSEWSDLSNFIKRVSLVVLRNTNILCG